jgi:hypothetical protein
MEKGSLEDLSDSEARTASRMMYGESEIVHEYGFEGALIEFEQRIWDVDDDLNHTWSARIDRYDWLPDARRLLVIDDKSGWTTPPPIHRNWQVRSEGALLADLFDAQETVVALIHPHHPDSLWEAAVYTRAQTRDLLNVVRHNVQKIKLPDQPRVAGSLQCQWCQAKRLCPEYQAYTAKLAQDIADEVVEEGFTSILRRSKKERGEHVHWLKEMQKNIEFMLKQYVKLMEKEGEDSVAGWRLKRNMLRKITDEVAAMELVRGAYGPDTLYACLTFSVAALEKELAKSGTLREAKDKVTTLLRPVLEYKKTENFLDEARSL